MRAAGVRSTVAVVALLAAICAGFWIALGDDFPDPSLRNVPPAGEDARKASDQLAVVAFGDNRESYTTIRGFNQVVDLKFLSAEEIAAFRAGGAAAARVVVASDLPEGKVVALVVQMSDRGAAIGTAQRLTEIQLEAGFQEGPARTRLNWVRTVPDPEADPPAREVGRIFYVHADIVVRVELAGNPGIDLDHALGALIDRQLTVMPADG